MISPPQLAANRENAQASTGPNTPEGKARSSQNAFKNGLASGRLIIPREDPKAYNALLAALLDEHQPATPTEFILVEALAKHRWLESRAQRLQAEAFDDDPFNLPRDFTLLLRYETTHYRAFHKSLATLLKLQKDRREAANGFVSQNASRSSKTPAAPPPDSCPPTPDSRREAPNGFVSQNASRSSEAPAIPTPDSCPPTPDPRREAATDFVSQESRAAGPTSLLSPDSCLLSPDSRLPTPTPPRVTK